VCGTVVSAPTASAATIISTFDTSAEGWTPNPGQATLSWVATGGNPGGHIRISDAGGGAVPFGSGAFAPAAFLGDLSSFLGGTLSLDMATFGGGGATFASFGRIQLSAWRPFSAPLTAAAWGKTEQEFLAILANVTSIGVPTDAFDGGDTIGIDNFAITDASAVPEPSSLLLLAAGILGFGLSGRRRKRQ
jgi:hypothetical protein